MFWKAAVLVRHSSKKGYLRGALYYFNIKQTESTYCILLEIYSEHALPERTCQILYARFESGGCDIGLEYEEHPGQPKRLKMCNWKH